MEGIELYVHVGIYGACIVFFFLSALFFALKKREPGVPPPLDRGSVPTQGLGLVDVAGVLMFLMFYGMNIFVSQDEVELSAGGLAFAFVLQLFMAGVVVVILCWRINLLSMWGLLWRRWWLAIIAVPTVFVIWSLMAVLDMAGFNEWIADLLGQEETRQEMVLALLQEDDPLVLGLLALVAVVGAPLSEEVIFRGYIYPVFKKFAGMSLAILFSGALFAVVHNNLAALLPLFVLGMVLAILYEATGSLWMPIAVHLVFNLGTVVVQNMIRLNPELLEEAETAALLCL